MDYIEMKFIPWMKHKLEVMYNTKISGNLHVVYLNDKYLDDSILDDYTSSYIIEKLFIENNIVIDNNNKLYCYLPFDTSQNIKNIAISLKDLFKSNCNIFIGSYTDNLSSENINYKPLENLCDGTYYISDNKSYEIFTALSDTHSVNIEPDSSIAICGCLENNTSNVTHIAFVNLINPLSRHLFSDYYVKGLTNTNNNFNWHTI